jgi:hypothetical protein
MDEHDPRIPIVRTLIELYGYDTEWSAVELADFVEFLLPISEQLEPFPDV